MGDNLEAGWLEDEIDTTDRESFRIDSDDLAEWAIKKVRDAREERDRLLTLVQNQQDELERKKQIIEQRYENDTDYLLYCLREYMGSVKVKTTKTQDTYQLLSGKLVRKKETLDYKVNSEELVAWLKANGKAELVKTAETPRWADIKKLLNGNPDTGITIVGDTGEIVAGVTAVRKPGKFDISFSKGETYEHL